MESISACSKSALDEIYQRLVDCNFRVEDQELVMFTIALLKVMGREGRGSGVNVSFQRVPYRQKRQKHSRALPTWRDVWSRLG